ncbi:MAG: ABC transporter ATP-binding protein [Acidimicrobiales bacterium]
MTEPVVRLDGAARTFDSTPPVEALKATDLVIDSGDYISIVGPSGSGKSTLLNLLGLLDSPSSGSYYLDGTDTSLLGERQLAGLRATRIGFVFQSFHLLGHRTATENVMLSELYGNRGRKGRRRRAIESLEAVGLGHRLDAYPPTMSGGERQRVAIARALNAQPSLLLADEPTGNLDTHTSEQILALFDALHSSGLTIAVITHDLDVSARAQRQINILDGNVTEQLAVR